MINGLFIPHVNFLGRLIKFLFLYTIRLARTYIILIKGPKTKMIFFNLKLTLMIFIKDVFNVFNVFLETKDFSIFY